MGKTVEQSLKQAERLYQSILKRAFEGKLVPHEPDEEPTGGVAGADKGREDTKGKGKSKSKSKSKREVKRTME